MPDKPKRRKNNKNKRKNKGQNQPNTRIQSTPTTEVETCEDVSLTPPDSSQQGNIQDDLQNSKLPEAVVDDKAQDKLSYLQNVKKENTNNNNHTSDISPTEKLSDSNILPCEVKENSLALQEYTVESPEKTMKKQSKSRIAVKSKSVDNDDQPTIVEVLDDEDKSLVIVDANNVLVTEVDPEIEWENAGDLKDLKLTQPKESPVPGALSVTTIPLNVAQCEQTKSMSPEEEKSLRNYLQSLKLSTNQNNDLNSMEIKDDIEQIVEQETKIRLRKKGFVEDSFISRLGAPRSLHVIDEEVSGESSVNSRRHSYLNEKKSDNEELEDEVFKPIDIKNKVFQNNSNKELAHLIPQQCIRVDAQIKDPEISEARGAWSTKTLESLTGAEIVYLTDSSSSTSSAYDINEADENNEESDISVRIITPTIEVVDTDVFLKNNFIPNAKHTTTDETMQNDDKYNIIENKKPDTLDLNVTDSHEIVVLSTDTIQTDLYVKDIENSESKNNPFIFKDKKSIENPHKNIQSDESDDPETKKITDQYDLEIKVLKCELNDAINNLIKEVISDSESADVNDSLVRQDSSSSVGSSQCTAKYNPKCSSLNDIPGNESDEFTPVSSDIKQLDDNKSHVKDVIETIEVNSSLDNNPFNAVKATPMKNVTLKDLCLGTICKLPYGEQILEELANVSERLQKMSDLSYASKYKDSDKEISDNITNSDEIQIISNSKISDFKAINNDFPVPPPVQPRKSSLKISHDETRNDFSTKSTPRPLNICLSPSQKMLMEKTNTFSAKDRTENINSESKGCSDLNTKQDINVNNVVNVPFKSQTGSRLLALLRSPSISSNSKENLTIKNWDGFSNNVSSFPETNIKRENDNVKRKTETNIPFVSDSSYSFKPIPPPKPRKFSSSFYECNHSSNFIENSMKSVKNENKYFHYSTGNLSKEIEDDISTIQNMHRYYNDIYKEARADFYPRRPSLPKELCDQQMEYILQKEKEVEAEINKLEKEHLKTSQRRGPRAPMLVDKDDCNKTELSSNQYHSIFTSKSSPKIHPGKLSSAFSKSEEELVRNKMYSEYVSQMAEREQRKQQKIIKITKAPHALNSNSYSKSESQLKFFEQKVNNRIEKEFIEKAKERWNKLGIRDPETEDEKENEKNFYREPKVIEHKIKVIDSGEEKDVKKLPRHLRDFVKFTVKDKSDSSSPGESERSEASSHGVVLCAVIILLLTITKYIMRLFR